MVLKRVLAVLFYFLLVQGQAQDFALSGDDLEWSEGQVTLTKGMTIKGAVRYNIKSGLLSFNDGIESKVLTPRSVVSFEYADAVRNAQRKFFSIEVEDSKGVKRPQFLEIIKECQTFAVITAQNPLELKKKKNWDPLYGNMYSNNFQSTKVVASQVEILYLIDGNGDINPYLIITNEELPRNFTNNTKTKTKSKIVGEDYLKNLTEPHYDALETYAREFKLDFASKEELIRILDHYDHLLSKE